MIGGKLLAKLDAKGRRRAARRATEQVASNLIARADAARDAGRFGEAGLLYAEALRLRPDDAGIHVQAGHMFKESFDLVKAEAHYRAAQALTPGDAEIALQMGHLFKTAGRLAEADAAYAKSATLDPAWPVPRVEQERLQQAGLMQPEIAPPPAPPGFDDETRALAFAGSEFAIQDLAARDPRSMLHGHGEGVDLRRLGRRERTHWGIEKTVRGVEALRGFCVSATPITEIQVLLNDQVVYRGPVRGGYPLPYENDRADTLRKFVFNIWFDFSAIVRGAHDIEFRLTDTRRRAHSRRERIVVAPPLDAAERMSSDGHVPSADPADPRPLDAQIEARPSMVRPGTRRPLVEPPKTVLVQRIDQLGDMVVSIPAIRRLREMMPQARLIGLLATANVDLARTTGLFDEIIAVPFDDDAWERRRIMSLERQAELKAKLDAYSFDIAIDLSESTPSRALLLLSQAPLLYGFGSGEIPWLDMQVEGYTHDRLDRHEVVPHTTKLVAMVEWLATILRNHSVVIRRDDLSRDLLGAFGLEAGARYAVLHSGARLQFSRWPGYADLAKMLLERTDLTLVLLAEGAPVPDDIAASPRVRVVEGRMEFDAFDALLHHCTVFVGNDSGPKHLASLRGAPVVSLHMARNNWNEWGQENGGFVISRKVPCAGCLIWHDSEECGRDFTCIRSITPEEVFGAVQSLIGG